MALCIRIWRLNYVRRTKENSALNLIFGFEFSLHLHIFERAALNFINAAILSVVFKLRHKYLFMRFLTPYLTVIILLAGTGI